MSKKSLKWCSVNYLAVGWTGHVPQACRAGFIAIPINLTGLFWGWPNRLLARMADAKVTVLLVGPVGLSGPKGIGVAQASALKHVPPKFPGYLITDNVEIIGPAMRRKATTGTAR